MKRHVIVKQKHLYTGEENLMFDGYAEITPNESCITFSYIEKDKKTNVYMIATEDDLQIKRNGEMDIQLLLREKEQTTGKIMSEFGMIDIQLYTHKYVKKENSIAIEYDIVNGSQDLDGYQIIWTIKEDFYE